MIELLALLYQTFGFFTTRGQLPSKKKKVSNTPNAEIAAPI
jgi:hypothetical protein